MPAKSTETRDLLLRITATTELLRKQMLENEQAVAKFGNNSDKSLSRFDAAIDRVNAGVGRLKTTVSGFALGAAAGFAGALSIDGLKNMTMAAFDAADAVADLSARTGASTDFIQELGYAAQLSGSSYDSANAAIEKFAKFLGTAQQGGKEQAATLRELGVTSKNVDEAFRQAADGVAKLDDITKQNATTLKVFGKSAGDMTPLLAGGSKAINQLAADARELGIVMDQDLIVNAGKVNDQFDTMKAILSAQTASAIVKNADAINQLAQAMTNGAMAAIKWVNSLSVSGNLSVLDNPRITSMASRLMGNDPKNTTQKAWNDLYSTAEGRQALWTRNIELSRQTMRGENADIADNPQARAQFLEGLKQERVALLRAAVKARGASSSGRGSSSPDGERSALDLSAADVTPKAPKVANAKKDELAKSLVDAGNAMFDNMEKRNDDFTKKVVEGYEESGRVRVEQIGEQGDIQYEQQQNLAAHMAEIYSMQHDEMMRIADVFENAMIGGTGSIIDQFESGFRRVIAELAAQWVQALAIKNGVSLGGGGGFMGLLKGAVGLGTRIFGGGAAASGVGGGGSLGSLSGAGAAIGLPPREFGGPVQAGKGYLVGEKRAEIFVPGASGTIIPRVPDTRGWGGGRTSYVRETVEVQAVPNAMFDVIVTRRAAEVAAPLAQRAMVGGAGLAAQEAAEARARQIV